MKPSLWIGLALLMAGVGLLLVPLPRTERDGVKVGGLSVGIETRHEEKAPPMVSAAMVLGGVGLMIAGRGKR
jgi:hypothetical protein